MSATLFLAVALGASAAAITASIVLRISAALLLTLSIVAFLTLAVLVAVTFQGFECDRADCDPVPGLVTAAKYGAAFVWIAAGVAAAGRYVTDHVRRKTERDRLRLGRS